MASESKLLEESWRHINKKVLSEYLVSGIHNPRINIMSILVRHFLLDRLFGKKFDALRREELAFAVKMNQFLETEAKLLRDSLVTQSVETEYNDWKKAAILIEKNISIEELNTFQNRWTKALALEKAHKISVIEPACGSANDYRCFHSFGLSPFLNYKGFDIAKPNIENAKQMFPNVQFEEGNILNSNEKDNAFAYLVVQDLFEHLSLEAMDFALRESCRIVRKGMALAFFNMAEIPEHIVQPVRLYHWNQLSREKMQQFLHDLGWTVEVTHISSLLANNYNYPNYYNQKAYIFLLKR